MIETLMALWNRGVGGRLMVIAITFFCICISISLLLVTVGGAWGSLFARAHPRGEGTHVVNSALVTATVPTSVATSQVVVAPTSTVTPMPCLASPTSVNGHTPQVNMTEGSGQTSVPARQASATPTHPRKTPTPGVTVTPKPKPSSTPPTVTPTSVVTPTATTLPPVTPTVIDTATVTPTVVSTPTATNTPGATPTSAPTIGIAPTATTTAITTPTVTTPAGSPTAVTSATADTGNTHTSEGGLVMSGTPSSVADGQQNGGNCLSDSLATGGVGTVLAMLQNFLWIILVSSLLGTALFCAQMYRMTRRRAERKL
ncbi:MAG: hypothetical protein ACRDIV_04170 [Ktedonobacteraceae bacterium]